MDCDCRECTKTGRLWSWLDGDPGPVSSFLTFGIMLGSALALLWWG